MNHNTPFRPAAFLDRDGTLIDDIPYLRDPAGVSVPAAVIAGLQLLQQAGFLLILISNQSGIARGYFTPGELAAVHERLSLLLAEQHIKLDGFYYCPHGPESCSCRKPATGMLEQACRDFQINRNHSCMIGDSDCDMLLARNFGIPGLLLKSDRNCDTTLASRVCPDFLAAARLAVSGMAWLPPADEQ